MMCSVLVLITCRDCHAVAGYIGKRRLERAIHCLVIRNLVGNVSLIEIRATELRELGALVSRCFG